jgi:hypothetical protein
VAVLVTCIAAGGCGGSGPVQEVLEPSWREEAVELPAAPQERDLVEVGIGGNADSYRYRIDLRSVSVGSDGVTRYTVVLTTTEGARNVFYEGIRCSQALSRLYAFGSSGGTFQRVAAESWEPLRRDGPRAYRFRLARGYLCDASSLPYERFRLLERLRHPNPPGFEPGAGGLW